MLLRNSLNAGWSNATQKTAFVVLTILLAVAGAFVVGLGEGAKGSINDQINAVELHDGAIKETLVFSRENHELVVNPKL